MFYAVEDALSEALLLATIRQMGIEPVWLKPLGRMAGDSHIISNIPSYFKLARSQPVTILLDLDRRDCPVEYLEQLRERVPANDRYPELLTMRIVTTEAESWLLADISATARLVGCAAADILARRDWEKQDAKEALLDLISRRGPPDLKKAILAETNSAAKVGPEYNLTLVRHVQENWSAEKAAARSESLARFLRHLRPPA